MDKLIMAAPAKVNLALDILGKNADGYHRVDMVMARVSLCDEVCVEKIDEGIFVTCDREEIPSGSDNIAYKAAQVFFEKFGVKGGARIHIKKRIPQAAGLAGGSADAAAVLKLLNRLYEMRLTDDYLEKAAVMIGADVPYCLYTSLARAEGIGERLTFFESPLLLPMVIVKPPVSVATKWAYEEVDRKKIWEHVAVDDVVAALQNGEEELLFGAMKNVFEKVVAKHYKDVPAAKEALKVQGALRAMMSGSGPSVFGIYATEEAAEKAAAALQAQGMECYACTTLS